MSEPTGSSHHQEFNLVNVKEFNVMTYAWNLLESCSGASSKLKSREIGGITLKIDNHKVVKRIMMMIQLL